MPAAFKMCFNPHPLCAAFHIRLSLSLLWSKLIPPHKKNEPTLTGRPEHHFAASSTGMSLSPHPPSLLSPSSLAFSCFFLSVGHSALFRHTPASFAAGSLGLAVC